MGVNVILDLSVAVIVLIFIIGGYRKGFAYTLIGTLGSLAAAIISSVAASFLSIGVYNQFVMPRVLETASGIAGDIPEVYTASQKAEKIFENLPDYAANILDMVGVNQASLAQKISETNLAIPNLIELLLRSTMIHLVTVVITMTVYVILTVAFSIAAKLITKASEETLIGTLNRLGGAVIGVIKAVLVIMVLALGVYLLMIVMPTETSQQISDGIQQSMFYQALNEFNIPDWIITNLTLK